MSEQEENTTLIRVSKSTWVNLNRRKLPGESFNDVIVRVLSEWIPKPQSDKE